MASNEPFGGISLVCFGDLLQLPPVKGNHPFMSVSFWEAKQRLVSVASMDLWQTFTYDELTINMRQSRDVRYGDLLSRARVGTCLLYTSPSPRDGLLSRMPSSA